ncbi:MAG: glycosyltransferase family 2 protein [Crocinitomicaceae bacterium]
MKPKISIITVAYNAEAFLEDTIKSIISQTYQNIEYIIIDGQSSDRTLEICKKYKNNIDILVSEPDKGLYDAMNKGVKKATGDVIGILNADDFYNSENVLEDVSELFTDSKVDCSYGDLVYVNPDNTNKIVRTWISGNYKNNAFLKGWMPPHPTFFIRKKHYETFGAYSLKLKSAADYELMLRMLHKEKLTAVYLDKVLVRMRTGGVSNASFINRFKANKEDKLAWEMNGLKPAPFTLIRKPLSKLKQFIKK